MFHAVFDNKLETIELLLKKEANVNTKDSGGNTPLFYAILNNKIDIITLLLKHGAEIEPNHSWMKVKLLKTVAQVLKDSDRNSKCSTTDLMQSIATLYGQPSMSFRCIDRIFNDAEQEDSLIIAQYFLTYLVQQIKDPNLIQDKPYHELLLAYCCQKIQTPENQGGDSWKKRN